MKTFLNKLTKKLVITSAGLVISWTSVNFPSAARAATILFDGSGTPDTVGWQLTSFVAEPPNGTVTVTPQFTGNASDKLSVSTTGTAVHFYSKNIDAANYLISIGVRVVRSSFNSYDSGLGLSPFAKQFFSQDGDFLYVQEDRTNSLTIGEKSIQWSDLVGDSFAIDTSVFHEYAISYIGGKLNIYVDKSFDDIINGIATPVLTRTGVKPQNGASVGAVAFGDPSNDSSFLPNCCVNSSYELDFVRFQSLDDIPPVPEPLTTVGSGVALGIGALIKRRYSKKRHTSI